MYKVKTFPQLKKCQRQSRSGPHAVKISNIVKRLIKLHFYLHMRKERRLGVFQKRVLRRIFGPKRDDVTGEGGKLHNEELNPLKPELNPICYLLALLGAHHFLHVSRIRVKLLTLRLLMSYIYIYIYIYMEHPFLMFLDHTQRRSTVGRTPLDE